MRTATTFKPQLTVEEHQDSIVGKSVAMQQVFKMVGRVSHSDAPVMITGESGTGKELVARAIHHYSQRSAKNFVAINCAAIPDQLLESELFGHEKGAFTGAITQRVGRFEQSEGGTLFLDEIGDMPLPLQGKILRVLQDGEFSRVGGRITLKSNVRIVAATNKNLEREVAENPSAKTSFIGSTSCASSCHRCASGPRTSNCWRNISCRRWPPGNICPRLQLSEEAIQVLKAITGRAMCANWRTPSNAPRFCRPPDILLAKDIPLGLSEPSSAKPNRMRLP